MWQVQTICARNRTRAVMVPQPLIYFWGIRMKIRTKVGGVLAGLTLLGSLAACGSTGKASATTTTSSTTTTTAAGGSSTTSSAPKTLQKVSLGLTSYNSLHLWVIVAKDEGLMKPYGVTFQPETFQNVADIVPGIISGSLDFGLATPEGTFAAQDKGGTVKIVALENVKNPYQMVTSSTVTSVSGLKGKTIAVDSIGVSADYVTGLTLLKHAGLSTTQYHFINGGAPATRVAGMLSGTINATFDFPPNTQQLTSKGMKVLLNAATESYFQTVAISAVLGDPKWYDAHKTLAIDFMKGYVASLKWLYTPANKSKAVADIAKTMSVSTTLATATYTYFVTKLKGEAQTPIVKLSNLQKQINNDTGAGVKTLPQPTSATLGKRYDNSLIKPAVTAVG